VTGFFVSHQNSSSIFLHYAQIQLELLDIISFNTIFFLISNYFLQMVNGTGISFNNILRFATCDDEMPLLGYERGANHLSHFMKSLKTSRALFLQVVTCVGYNY
jgi:hypothetical protein